MAAILLLLLESLRIDMIRWLLITLEKLMCGAILILIDSLLVQSRDAYSHFLTTHTNWHDNFLILLCLQAGSSANNARGHS